MTGSRGVALIVNDDLFFGGRILSVLENLGFRVETSATREAAVARAGKDLPGLVVVNLNSRRLNAMAVLRELRSASPGSRILAFVSHLKIPSVREEAIASGADAVCANSAVSMRLPALVRQLLEGSASPPLEAEPPGGTVEPDPITRE